MGQTRKDLMMEAFREAQHFGKKFIAVSVQAMGTNADEIIVNPIANADFKMNYYDKAYDDDLVLKTNKTIRITGWCYGDSMLEIGSKI